MTTALFLVIVTMAVGIFAVVSRGTAVSRRVVDAAGAVCARNASPSTAPTAAHHASVRRPIAIEQPARPG
jgi:UPF0716 family protein affecting phage T7 exclusion